MTELLHFTIGCLFAFLLQLCWYRFKSRNAKTDRVTYADYDNGVLTVEWNNGEATQFSGNGIIWYHLPMMSRCDTRLESELFNLWVYCTKWNAPYPDGHIKDRGYILRR